MLTLQTARLTDLSGVEECMIVERKAKIGYFGVIVFGDENVPRSQITVNHFFGLQVLHPTTCVTMSG